MRGNPSADNELAVGFPGLLQWILPLLSEGTLSARSREFDESLSTRRLEIFVSRNLAGEESLSAGSMRAKFLSKLQSAENRQRDPYHSRRECRELLGEMSGLGEVHLHEGNFEALYMGEERQAIQDIIHSCGERILFLKYKVLKLSLWCPSPLDFSWAKKLVLKT